MKVLKKTAAIAMFTFAVTSHTPLAMSQQHQGPLPQRVNPGDADLHAALEGGWEAVFKLLTTQNRAGPELCSVDVGTRLAAAHSLLALGRNDEATKLFYCPDRGCCNSPECLPIRHSCVIALAEVTRHSDQRERLHRAERGC